MERLRPGECGGGGTASKPDMSPRPPSPAGQQADQLELTFRPRPPAATTPTMATTAVAAKAGADGYRGETKGKGVEGGGGWRDYSSVFTNAKAGMDYSYRSKEQIQKVVYEVSKGSAHFENEQRKEAATQARGAEMRSKQVRVDADLSRHVRACVQSFV